MADASLKWYQKVRNTLELAECKVSSLDKALFMRFSPESSLIGLICVHVDDFIWCGNEIFEEKVISRIQATMHVGTAYSSSFKYLGLELEQLTNSILLNQNGYAKRIEFLNESSEVSSKDFRAKLGQLSWLASQTRPDINFAVNVLSTRISEDSSNLTGDINKTIKMQNVVKFL